MNISSPCINVCKLANEICIGCFRTTDEIARWTQMSDREKSMVNAAPNGRRKIGAVRGEPEMNPCPSMVKNK
jgi:predicted Fe-S protein YdhL (DUF1289 family)